MSSTLKTILSFVLILHLSGCQQTSETTGDTPGGKDEWCDVIYPNGTYTGLKMYDIYEFEIPFKVNVSEIYHKHSMFIIDKNNNTLTKEWNFIWDFTELQGLTLELTSDVKTIESAKFPVIHKFSLKDESHIYNCIINKKWVDCKRFDYQNLGNHSAYILKVSLFTTHPFIIYPINDINIMAINKNNRSDYLVMSGGKASEDDCNSTLPKPEGIPEWCKPLKYLHQMGDKLFKSIESIVEITNGEQTAHLLLFNINGRAKYCFNYLNQSISPECNSSSLMKTLKGECLPEEPQTSTVETPDNMVTSNEPGDGTSGVGTTDDTGDGETNASSVSNDGLPSSPNSSVSPTETKEKSVLLLVLIIIIVIIIVIVGIIAFLYFYKKKEPAQPQVQPQESGPSTTGDKKVESNTEKKPINTQKGNEVKDQKVEAERSRENIDETLRTQ